MVDKKSVRAFVSHSHADKQVAEELSKALRELGVDAWLDKWEIQPGDSLVQKVFEEGLRDCQLFIILLSPDSTNSDWVKHELDSAIVQRISGVTRVVPVMVSPCDIPVALRPLLRLDVVTDGLGRTAKRLADVAFGRTDRPELVAPESKIVLSVPGLTENSARVAVLLSSSMDQPDGSPRGFSGGALVDSLKVTPEDINDAVDELKSMGLVRTINWMGTRPFDFGHVEPTPQLAFALRGTDVLDYDPEDDIKAVVATVCHEKEVNGEALHAATNLSPSRLNRAVSYLEDYNIARVQKSMRTAPYRFHTVLATATTRRFAAENCR